MRPVAKAVAERLNRAFWLVAVMCAVQCGRGTIQPVAIFPEDMCAHCRMAISEKRCAAEFVAKNGAAVKFDDIGCMMNYLKAHGREDIAAVFLQDFDGRGWISAAEAFLVASSSIKTPMGSGTVAFKDNARAAAAAARYGGEVKHFGDVMP